MDTRTRHALKKDKFAQAAASSASWIGEHQAAALRWGIVVGVVVAVAIAGLIFWNVRSSAANTALGAALDVYATPLAVPGAPSEPGAYTTAAARGKEANREFVAIAHDYSWLPAAAKAHYFAGVTYEDLGQNSQAESELKTAAGAWDRNTSNLAKLALAGLYRQTSRDNDAIALYNEIIAKPSATVSASVAQLDLADLYAAEGKQDMARVLWAKVKDADKDGAAGSIASEKLAAK
ncbi:MAG TPA: tetratricopeptide repeat protein [Terracidiphilus sp.]|nr:tetratricopeptide repeat protein [Terracidiphilus sp.]